MERTRQEEREYWLFSKATGAAMARCRNEVPLEEVMDATAEEAAAICAKIREQLAAGEFYEIWIEVLVYFHDTSALPALQQCLKTYKERRRLRKRFGGGWTPYIRLLRKAIRELKRER